MYVQECMSYIPALFDETHTHTLYVFQRNKKSINLSNKHKNIPSETDRIFILFTADKAKIIVNSELYPFNFNTSAKYISMSDKNFNSAILIFIL